jgi:hypothetical protein
MIHIPRIVIIPKWSYERRIVVHIISYQGELINSISGEASRNIILGVKPLEAVGYRYRTAEAEPSLW